MSWLTVLHFTDRHALLKACARLLKPHTGRWYTADFYARHPLSKSERRTLAADVWCRYLPDEATYRADLECAGLVVVEFADCTDAWRALTRERADEFDAQRAENEHLYGADTCARLGAFYRVIAELFAGGNLGGVCVTARKL